MNAYSQPLPAGHARLLLDFPADTPPPNDAVARVYDGACTHLWAEEATQLDSVYAALQAALVAGQHAVVLASYEMGAALQGLPVLAQAPDSALFEAFVFDDVRWLTAAERTAWLMAQAADDAPAGCLCPQASLSESEFQHALARIADHIRAGDTYQINFTFPLAIQTYGHPAHVYQRLAAHQPVAYGAYLHLPSRQNEGGARYVLSRSPELFMQRQGRKLAVRPMKGTVAASEDAAENQRRAEALANDTKNRAENVMIVDLLRNDLGRIAEAGSVKVEQLFAVEPYRTVLQMTSTVSATAQVGLNLQALWQALFPCGSITGAPKRHTMQLLQGLETAPRGLYTGAIGWMSPPTVAGEALGDFCFSVPIRTLLLNQHGQGRLNVGSGVVHDSDARQEWAECQLKARFLTGLPSAVGLIETFAGTAQGFPRLALHWARLTRSAAALGLPWHAAQQAQVQAQLDALQASLPDQASMRCRLQLNPDGTVQLTHAPLMPLQALPQGAVKLFWAKDLLETGAVVSSHNPLLQHKTTARQAYDAAWQAAEQRGGFDALFTNQRGEITEGGRSTLWLRHGPQWRTPALACGVLAGVMREAILAQPSAYGFGDEVSEVCEAVLTPNDVHTADEIRLSNSLRGVLPAVCLAVDYT